MKKLNSFVLAILVAASIWAGGTAARAADDQAPTYAEAIRDVLEEDSRLATVRNHAPENAPIAEAVEEYVAGLDGLDLEHCPPEFARALRRHREAWRDSIEFFKQYPDLRGEMHDVFEAIRVRGDTARARLEAAEARIWSTWKDVEKATKDYAAPH